MEEQKERIASEICMETLLWTHKECLDIAFVLIDAQNKFLCNVGVKICEILSNLYDDAPTHFVRHTSSPLDTLTTKDLKEICRTYNANVSGSKNEIIQRIQDVEKYALSKLASTKHTLTQRCIDKLSESKKITKRTAKDVYGLTDKEIDSLPFITTKNPIFKRAVEMRLFNLSDVREVSRKKFGTEQALEEYQQKKRVKAEKARQTRKQKKEAQKNDRYTKVKEYLQNKGYSERAISSSSYLRDYINTGYDEYIECFEREEYLKELLHERGLELRDDSKLCESYIENGTPDEHKVVEIMEEMDFFFKHTDYQKFMNSIMNEEPIDREMKIDSIDASEEAKNKALSKWCKEKVKNGMCPTDCEELPMSLTTWRPMDAGKPGTPKRKEYRFLIDYTSYPSIIDTDKIKSHKCKRQYAFCQWLLNTDDTSMRPDELHYCDIVKNVDVAQYVFNHTNFPSHDAETELVMRAINALKNDREPDELTGVEKTERTLYNAKNMNIQKKLRNKSCLTYNMLLQ